MDKVKKKQRNFNLGGQRLFIHPKNFKIDVVDLLGNSTNAFFVFKDECTYRSRCWNV